MLKRFEAEAGRRGEKPLVGVLLPRRLARIQTVRAGYAIFPLALARHPAVFISPLGMYAARRRPIRLTNSGCRLLLNPARCMTAFARASYMAKALIPSWPRWRASPSTPSHSGAMNCSSGQEADIDLEKAVEAGVLNDDMTR